MFPLIGNKLFHFTPLLSFLVFLFFLFSGVLSGAEFFVSTDGDDLNPGTITEPFATISKARDAVRNLAQTEPYQDFIIYLRGGRYFIDQAIVFDWRDSLDYNFKLIITGWTGETPVLSAGKEVKGWTVVQPGEAPANLPAAAEGKLWVADIPPGLGNIKCLYDEIGHLPRARMAGFQPEKNYDDPEASKTELYYPAGAGIKNWSNLQDIELIIRPDMPWVMNILPVASVDETNCIVTTSIEGSYSLVKQRFTHWPQPDETAWIENTIEGLDSPGEWVVNTAEGKIYLWPRGCFPETIWAPATKDIIRVEGSAYGQYVRNISFRQLIFEHGERHTVTADEASIQHDWEFYDQANAMLRFRHAESCQVLKCRFQNSGGAGVRLDQHCKRITIAHNEFTELGGSGVVLCGFGPGTQDRNMEHLVYNNEIHRCGLLYWQSHAVIIFQSRDNIISYNHIYDMPYNGIAMTGAYTNHFLPANSDNREVSRTIRWAEVGGAGTYTWDQIEPYIHTRNNIIENNNVHNVMQVLGDGNGVYIRFCPAGNIIRRNYFHDIVDEGAQAAIRCDGNQHGVEVYENLIYHCVRTAITTKGRNSIYNNVMADMLSTEDPDNIHNVQLYSYLQITPRPGDNCHGSFLQRNIFYHDGPSIDFAGDIYAQPDNPDVVFHGNSETFSRIALAHLPWTTGTVFWDSGADETGYDRISKHASQSEYEGQWNHWCFVKNAATGSMKIYLNGSLWHQGAMKTRSLSVITDFNIGSHAGGGTGFYKGKIDDFRIYNYEVTEDQVADIMDSLSPVRALQSSTLVSDINEDFLVNYIDFALFAENWLDF